MAEIAKKVGKTALYGGIGTVLTAIGAEVAVRIADYFGQISSDDPGMQVVKYTTMVGAAVAFAGAAAYQAFADSTDWYTVTPRGGQGKVIKEMQEILDNTKGIGHKHKETLAELLGDLSKDAVDNDVAYDIGIKKVKGNDVVYVRRFERGSVTGLTYSKEMSLTTYQLVNATEATGKAYIELGLKDLQALESGNLESAVKGGKKKPKPASADAPTPGEPPKAPEVPETTGGDLGGPQTETTPEAPAVKPK